MAFRTMALVSQTYKSLGLDDPVDGITGTPQVVLSLSFVLDRLIQKNEKLMVASKLKDTVSIFHGSRAPNLSIKQYIERIFKYAGCSPSAFLIAYIYMDRLFQRTGGHLTSLNVNRLLITTIMVAAKFIDDACHNNDYYAKVGGISNAEMNKLELELLFNLDFRLFVTTEVFSKYCEQLGGATIQEYQIQRPIDPRIYESWQDMDNTRSAAKLAGYGCRPL
ncbi:Cyclin [Quillaja saponaria]|uniref:Cyclin n=1 Tax=Quillaja saponaria TaxID=32244 RepID=A0AAD7VJL5_QUISA|nr:Cyclin [Quillaja saponaria]